MKILWLLNFGFVIFCFAACLNDKSKKELQSSDEICNNLFVETYTIFGGGAGGGDRVSEYLTDSSYFRKYIGTFVQGYKHYYYQCIGDTIRVYKITEVNQTEDSSTFLLSKLKADKIFE